MRKSTDPQTGWFMAPPFHLGRTEAPGAPLSYLMAQSSQSTMMPNTKRPLQNGRHSSCRWLGICLKEQKHRAGTMRSLSRPFHRHWSVPQNLLHHLCSGYFQGGSQRHAWWMAGETSINTAKLEAKDRICFVSRALRRQNLLQLDMNYLDSDKRQLQVFFIFI